MKRGRSGGARSKQDSASSVGLLFASGACSLQILMTSAGACMFACLPEALKAALKNGMPLLPRALLRALVLILFVFVCAVHARDMQRELLIEQALAQRNPGQVEGFRKGREALDKGDYAAAEPLFRQVTDFAPEFDVAHRRLGASLQALGRVSEARAEYEKAFTLNASAFNRLALANVIAYTGNTTVTALDKTRALSLLEGCKGLPDGDEVDVLSATAGLALSLEREGLFESTTQQLHTLYPDSIATHYFAAIQAARGEHWMESEDEILRAEKLGLPHASVQEFLGSGIGNYALGWRLAKWTAIVVSAWALGLGLLFGGGFLLSKLTLSQAERADVFLAITPLEARLRKLYRQVLNFAGIYYYVSLPVIMVLLVATFSLALYLCLLVGRIPVQLLLALALGAVMTIYAMGRSLLVKVKEEDPGRSLSREEAPALWALTEEVAASVNTRPIDEIRITPGTELAVYERGSWRDKLHNRATRILILGTAVLEGFKTDHFRSVLAHEYGHFSNRDTAGGDIALRVQRDMFNFYKAMYEAGQATLMNVGFHFLRLYNLIFRRISHGATRLQEILADRVAAQCYGAEAFEGGLRHVIRRSLVFDKLATAEIDAAIKAERPLQSLYSPPESMPADLDEAFEASINRPTTADDTHPDGDGWRYG